MSLLLVKDLISKRYSLQGSSFGGTVVDVEDPLRLNRVKVALWGKTDQIEKEELPWYPVYKSAGRTANSSVDIPPIDSNVVVKFDTNSIYDGVVISMYRSTPPAEGIVR